MITDAVVVFLGKARSVAVGSCDAEQRPHGMRVAAVRVAPDRSVLTVFLAQALAGPTLANVRVNPRLAIQASCPEDYRTLQLKGRVLRARPAEASDHSYIREFVAQLAQVVDQLGMPFERVMRMNDWPAVAFDVQVEDVFLQTPGPGAGQPLAGRTP